MWGNPTLFDRAKSIEKFLRKDKYRQKLLKKNIAKKINIDKIN